MKVILKSSSALMIRNLYDWDCGEETNFWEVICDRFYEIAELPSKTRNQVRRCLRDCDIRRITNIELIGNDGYRVLADSFKRYSKVTTNVPTRDIWEEQIQTDTKYEYWGVFRKDDGLLIAWGMNSVRGNGVNYLSLKAIPEYLNKHYPYFGLLFEMGKYYLKDCGFKYVSDGCRSVTEHSNIQPFLEKNFLFRKAYCRLQIRYKWWLQIGVHILYPFRRFIPTSSVLNVLKFEEINRSKVTQVSGYK